MLRQRCYLATILWALSCCTAACSNAGAHIDKDPSQKTVLAGSAPLNAGGRLRVLRDGITVAVVPKIASDGSFFVQVGQAGGDYLIEATGGAYIEAATHRRIRLGDERLHAWAFDVQARERVQVAVTPFSELLYAYTLARPGQPAHDAARGFLEEALGCVDMGIVRAHPAQPSVQEPLTTANAAELSYIYLGGWSTLAKSVGEGANKGPAAVTSVRLMRAIADTLLARGGRLEGDVAVADDLRLPSDVLRQPWAQATWSFLRSRPAHVDIEATAVQHLLACASSAPPSMWGPAGGPVDFFGPDVTLDAPGVFASATAVRCEARDDSTVKSLALKVSQNGQPVSSQATPGEDKTGIMTPQAALVATLDPGYLQDGNVTLTCTAVDRWDNQTSKTVVIAVNRGQGTVATHISPIVEHDGRAYVQGMVTVTCACADAYPDGEAACGLSQASLATPGIGEPTRQVGRASYAWDTTQATDGIKQLVCEGRSQGLQAPLVGSQYVWVGNLQPVRVVGEVHLDTLVKQMRVTAYAFEGARKGAVLGSADASHGEFALTISNEYVGPLLIEATPVDAPGSAKASYTNLALAEPMYVDTHRLSLLWDHYAPAQGLPSVLHINAATTLAASLAAGMYRQAVEGDGEAGDLAAASRRAHALIGQHLQPDGSLDPRLTAVADLADRQASRAPNSVRLGLFHVGMSRLAAEQSEDGPPFYSSLNLLAQLLDDASNGTLDGLAAGRGGDLFLGDYPLSAHTLRRDLAAATKRWLRSDALHGQQYALSNLDVHAYSRSGQYLATLAQDDSALFDGVQGQPFDEDGPELGLRMREGDGGKDWTDMPEGQTFRGALYLDVRADDDSDVMDFQVVFGGKVLRDDGKEGSRYALETPSARGLFVVNSARFPDGDITIVVTAHDRVGNPSEMSTVITLDNTPPEIGMATEFVSQQGHAVLQGNTDKPIQSVRVMHGHTEVGHFDAAPGIKDLTTFAVPVELPCNVASHLTLTATDFAGNESRPHDLLFRCDSSPPTLHWIPTDFQQEFSGESVQLPSGVVLQKHLHRMGSKDSNLPTMRLYADDLGQGRMGSAPERLRAQYHFTMENHGRRRSTPWRDLDAVQDSVFPGGLGYVVQLCYENMLPPDVLDLDATSIRAANYVARATPADRYTLTVRIADEAGNVTQEDVEVRLDVKSTPVEINCQTYSYGEILENGPLSPSHIAHLSAQGHRSLSVSATWKVPDAELAAASELVPQLRDVSAVVTLPTVYRETKVEQTVRQLAVLKRMTWIAKGHEGEWCQDHGNSWARVWSDGECEAHMHSTQSESRHLQRSPKFSQRLVPDAPSLRVRGAASENTRIAYASVDGTPAEVAADVHGRQRVQYSFRTATEYERHVRWGHPDRVWLDERLFAEALAMQHTFSGASVSVDTFPAPSKIFYSPSCQRPWSFRG